MLLIGLLCLARLGGGRGVSGHDKFDRFFASVCAKCARRGDTCGCEEGIGAGVFKLLYDYTLQYEAWATTARSLDVATAAHGAGQGAPMEGVKFVIVDACCGIGNHLFMAVRGLMVALRLGRALVLSEGNEVEYDFTSVLPLMPPSVPSSLGWPGRSTKAIATDHRDGHLGVEFYTCGNWEQLQDYDFIQLQGMQDVHLMMMHPQEGPWFRRYFGGTPFFFLSHFLWSGEEQWDLPVQTQAWPQSERYSGQLFSIASLVAELSADAAADPRAAVVGMQIRTGVSVTTRLEHGQADLLAAPQTLAEKNRDYFVGWESLILFPHRQLLEEDWDGLGASPLARYCMGDKSSLHVVLPCIESAIAHVRAELGARRILLLLATGASPSTCRPLLLVPLPPPPPDSTRRRRVVPPSACDKTAGCYARRRVAAPGNLGNAADRLAPPKPETLTPKP